MAHPNQMPQMPTGCVSLGTYFTITQYDVRPCWDCSSLRRVECGDDNMISQRHRSYCAWFVDASDLSLAMKNKWVPLENVAAMNLVFSRIVKLQLGLLLNPTTTTIGGNYPPHEHLAMEFPLLLCHRRNAVSNMRELSY